eukprot:708197_1
MLSAFSMHYSLPFGSCSFHFITSLSSVICPAQCPAFNVIYLCLLCTLSSGIRNNILPMEPMIRRDAPAVISRRFDHLFFHKYFPGDCRVTERTSNRLPRNILAIELDERESS